MDVFEVYYLGQDGVEPDDIPKTDEPVWVLGKKYNAVQGWLTHILDFKQKLKKIISLRIGIDSS